MPNISHILLIVVVGLVIVYLFENIINKKTPELFHPEKIFKYELPKNVIKTINACPLRENDLKTEYYIRKQLLSNDQCPKPAQSINEFNKDFFKFRDHTWENSSMTLDPVDKITDLYLSGNLGQANNSNMKIKDVYDNLTKGTNPYSRDCVRLPYFDNTMNDGYNYSFVSGMHNTRDTWMYENENQLNGGLVDKNLYPHDLEDIKNLPVL